MSTTYTVNKPKMVAGVSAWTLRHYHRIGLLPPARVCDEDYWFYDATELVRL